MMEDVIKCFQKGLTSMWKNLAKPCIYALRVCSLEMRHVITKLLPSILSDLLKISFKADTVVPILEFVSSIIRMPLLYANFVEVCIWRIFFRSWNFQSFFIAKIFFFAKVVFFR